jgi:hypothetical protein
MNMQHQWEDVIREKPKYSEKNLSQCQSAHLKSYREWPEIEYGHPW